MSTFLRIGLRNRVFRRERVVHSTYETQSLQNTEFRPDQTSPAAMIGVMMQAINEAEGQSIAAIIRNSMAKCNLFSHWPGGQSEFMTRLKVVQ